jgi:hypothetical protein
MCAKLLKVATEILGTMNIYSLLILLLGNKPQGGEQAIIRAHRGGAMRDNG